MELVCQNCSNTFHSQNSTAKFCSTPCKKAGRRISARKYNNKIRASTKTPIPVIACAHCGNDFQPTNKRVIYCSDHCKQERTKLLAKQLVESKKQARLEAHPQICKQCGNSFTGNYGKMFCSQDCARVNRIEKQYVDKVEGIDYIHCPVCDQKVGLVSGAHARMHGFKNAMDMAKQLGIDSISLKCVSLRDKVRGEKNGAYQHGGKFSPWSKNCEKYDEARHQQFIKDQTERMRSEEGKRTNPFFLEYWIDIFEGDEELAKEAYIKSQTRDLQWFTEKYGADEGARRHKAKTEKWAKSFKKTNFSAISQLLFCEVFARCPAPTDMIYFATHEREDTADYVNNEYILNVRTTYVRPDFICLTRKKIIEFDGEYWHSPAIANPERERIRDEMIIEAGYEILHIAEFDYNKNPEQEIQRCLDFLQ